jgi:hypothetical protein
MERKVRSSPLRSLLFVLEVETDGGRLHRKTCGTFPRTEKASQDGQASWLNGFDLAARLWGKTRGNWITTKSCRV